MNVTFWPRYKQVTMEENSSLMQVMMEHHIGIDFVCGGNGTCGKCKVLISKGNQMPYTNIELQCLSKEEREAGYRLACEFEITEDTCVILEEHKTQKTEQKIVTELLDGTIDIAFDIGTTTIEAAFLWNKETIVTKMTCVNPQRVHGLDVMSRLSYAVKSAKQAVVLQALVLDGLNGMITEFCNIYSVKELQINRIIVMGNTTMIYLLLNYPIASLTKPPFQIKFSSFVGKAKEYGFCVNEACQLFVPPLIQGYVGSDTLGCILATGIESKQGIYGIMDVGTNGELVISCNGDISVCSTAAGPAFEGASIVQGMRAQEGAIYQVSKKEKKKWDIHVIGDVQAKGICGSGLLDAICIFRELGWIDETGLMKERKIALDRDRKVSLWQEDVRQFQLAKAAIQAGFSLLAETKKITFDQLDKIYITGAFGSGLNVEHAMECGLFPKIGADKFEYMDNGSLIGGIQILQDVELMEQAEELALSIQHIELANMENFRDRFLEDMNLIN